MLLRPFRSFACPIPRLGGYEYALVPDTSLVLWQAVCALWEEGRVLSAERAAQALPEGGSRAAHRLRLALAAEAHRVRAAWGQARGCERREGWKVRGRALARRRSRPNDQCGGGGSTHVRALRPLLSGHLGMGVVCPWPCRLVIRG